MNSRNSPKPKRIRRTKVQLGKSENPEADQLADEVQREMRAEIAALGATNTERQSRNLISAAAAKKIAQTVFDSSAQASYSVKRTSATRADVEAMMAEMQQLLDQVAGGDLSAIRDKLVAQLAVLDAVFHAATREAASAPPGNTVQQRLLKIATDVQDQFLKASVVLEHFRKPVKLPERIDASRMDAWLIQRARVLGTNRIRLSQLAQYGPVGLRNGQERQVMLEVLEQANRIRVIEPDDRSGHVIIINPKLLELDRMESESSEGELS